MIMEEKRMKITSQTGLVLEGGGMRGVFTCGVLDYLMDAGIRFPYTIGVSAGACNGLSYMSHQKGRGKYSNIDLLAKYKYIGIRPLLKKRGLIDQKLLFHRFPDRILPYNYKAYAENPNRFEMVTTDCLTGRACYWEEKYDAKLNPSRLSVSNVALVIPPNLSIVRMSPQVISIFSYLPSFICILPIAFKSISSVEA